MHKVDHSEDEDFYTQDFEKEGVVSVWAGLIDRSELPAKDTLQDLCGVGYYRIEFQEGNSLGFKEVDLRLLFDGISYADTFLEEALLAAKNKGLKRARWITVQYDFEYDPSRVRRVVADDPIFLGAFAYAVDR